MPAAATRYSLTDIPVGFECIQADTEARWRYNGPDNAAIAGVFLAGGARDGIYYDTGETYGGRPAYARLGVQLPEGNSDYASVVWDSGCWYVFYPDVATGDTWYRCEEDVARPDLCHTWMDNATGSPMALSVVPVTRGELDAGVRIRGGAGGAGGEDGWAMSLESTFSGGRPMYGGNVDQGMSYGPNGWGMNLASAATGNTTFPWQADWSGNHPAPTVTRNDVAAPANWVIVP